MLPAIVKLGKNKNESILACYRECWWVDCGERRAQRSWETPVLIPQGLDNQHTQSQSSTQPINQAHLKPTKHRATTAVALEDKEIYNNGTEESKTTYTKYITICV